MDLDIEPGLDFSRIIHERIASSDVIVVVIGRQWLSVNNAGGTRRIDDPRDWIHLEVAAALQRDVRLIPVLVQGASMPAADDLPEALRPLATRKALELSDSRWDYDVSRLSSAVERAVDDAKRNRGAPSQPSPKPAPESPVARDEKADQHAKRPPAWQERLRDRRALAAAMVAATSLLVLLIVASRSTRPFYEGPSEPDAPFADQWQQPIVVRDDTLDVVEPARSAEVANAGDAESRIGTTTPPAAAVVPAESARQPRTDGARNAIPSNSSPRSDVGAIPQRTRAAGDDQGRVEMLAPDVDPAPVPRRVGGTIKAPTQIRKVNPAYPEEARLARQQGVVIVEVSIGVDGTVTDARVLRSVPMLDDAALEAVRQWTYTPTLVDGVAVPVIMTVTVNFTLQ